MPKNRDAEICKQILISLMVRCFKEIISNYILSLSANLSAILSAAEDGDTEDKTGLGSTELLCDSDAIYISI